MVVYGGVCWFAVVCGGLWWFAVICGGLSFSHTVFTFKWLSSWFQDDVDPSSLHGRIYRCMYILVLARCTDVSLFP